MLPPVCQGGWTLGNGQILVLLEWKQYGGDRFRFTQPSMLTIDQGEGVETCDFIQLC